MIFDCSNYLSQYAGLGPGFQKAFAYLAQTDLKNLEPGKYAIDGDKVFALVSSYVPKPVDQAKWEAHKKYADIQVVLEGSEKQGFAPMKKAFVTEAYIPERDIEFLSIEQGNYLTMSPGVFAVYFPQDAHQPGVEAVPGGPVKKVVIKVLV